VFDPVTRELTGYDGSVEHLRRAVEGSLRRLNTDRIDLYQLHNGDLPLEQAALLRDECEALVREGKIVSYGWSTDDPERARFFCEGEHGVAAQADINVLFDNPEMYAGDYAVLCRRPLAMGLLARETFSALPADDVRVTDPAWLRFFVDGKPSPEYFQAREAVRDVLTSGGRTLVQGALAWFWARSPRLIPIPGVRTVAQVEENAGALAFGPLSADELAQVEAVLR
jgi:aryl-alcohol dehydrogenase-like predicted oxidoreductase